MTDLVHEIWVLGRGQQVCWLPALLNWLQQWLYLHVCRRQHKATSGALVWLPTKSPLVYLSLTHLSLQGLMKTRTLLVSTHARPALPNLVCNEVRQASYNLQPLLCDTVQDLPIQDDRRWLSQDRLNLSSSCSPQWCRLAPPGAGYSLKSCWCT